MSDKTNSKKPLDSCRAKRGECRVVEVSEMRYLMVDGHGDAKTRSILALHRFHHGDHTGVHEALLEPPTARPTAQRRTASLAGAGWLACAGKREGGKMAVTGLHALLYSSDAEALRDVLAEAFGFENVDDGQDAGWLIFRMPPAEMGVHPGDAPAQEISFMCDDLGATIEELSAKGIEFRGEPVDQGWGVTTTMVLPGGVEMLLYEPRHNTAI